MDFTKYCLILCILFQGISSQNVTQNVTVSDEPPISINDVTLATYFSLDNSSNEYVEFNIEDLVMDSRRITTQYWGWGREKLFFCFYIQTTYRNAMLDIHRYYFRRTLYKTTLEYEIGYLTHEIVWRYRTMVELHQYLVDKYEKHPKRNLAPVSLMLYIYTNVLAHAKTILHLCNMMHELERKYRGQRIKGVFDDYIAQTEESVTKKQKEHNRTIVEDHQAAYDRYLEQLRREEKRRRKIMREQRKKVLQLGSTTPRGKATQKKSKWPFEYGWSIENW